jgi:hypothetical protein
MQTRKQKLYVRERERERARERIRERRQKENYVNDLASKWPEREK